MSAIKIYFSFVSLKHRQCNKKKTFVLKMRRYFYKILQKPQVYFHFFYNYILLLEWKIAKEKYKRLLILQFSFNLFENWLLVELLFINSRFSIYFFYHQKVDEEKCRKNYKLVCFKWIYWGCKVFYWTSIESYDKTFLFYENFHKEFFNWDDGKLLKL